MKVFHISDMDETPDFKRGFLTAFKYFQLKEAFRHKGDIIQCAKEVRGLKEIQIPKELTLDMWIEP